MRLFECFGIFKIRSPRSERLGLGCCGTERPGKGGREPALTSQHDRTSKQTRQRRTQRRAIPLTLSQSVITQQNYLSSSSKPSPRQTAKERERSSRALLPDTVSSFSQKRIWRKGKASHVQKISSALGPNAREIYNFDQKELSAQRYHRYHPYKREFHKICSKVYFQVALHVTHLQHEPILYWAWLYWALYWARNCCV